MEKKKLGNTDLQIAPLVFGGNVFGWTADEKTSFAILDKFIDSGFNFIDTADVYARWATGVGGESETILGKWMKLRGNRNKVIIGTKGAMDMGQGKIDVTKKYLLKAAEASLKRLQIDCIDLYQTHKDDEAVPVEEALEAHAQLIKEGKIRYGGTTSFTPARLKESLEASKKHNLPRYEVFQTLYNLCEREVFEKELKDICIQNKIPVTTYFSLASGFLTGKYRSKNDLSKSIRGDRCEHLLNEKGFKILKALDVVAAENSCDLSSVALAWLLEQPAVIAPIASARTLEQLDPLIKGVQLKLSKESIDLLHEASKW